MVVTLFFHAPTREETHGKQTQKQEWTYCKKKSLRRKLLQKKLLLTGEKSREGVVNACQKNEHKSLLIEFYKRFSLIVTEFVKNIKFSTKFSKFWSEGNSSWKYSDRKKLTFDLAHKDKCKSASIVLWD